MAQSGKVNHNFGNVQIGNGSLKRSQVKLVSASSFATQASAAISDLVLPDGSAFTLPVGAYITAAVVEQTTTITSAGSGTYDIGVAATGITSATIFDAVTFQNVNLGVVSVPAVSAVTGDAISTTNLFVTVTVNIASNTAGALKVNLEYLEF